MSLTIQQKRKIKPLLFKLWGNKCFHCGCGLDKSTATIDHLVPQSKGGSDLIDNLRLSCQRCNALKGNKIWAERMNETNCIIRENDRLGKANTVLSEGLNRQKIQTERWKKIASHYSEVIRILTKKFNKDSLEKLLVE